MFKGYSGWTAVKADGWKDAVLEVMDQASMFVEKLPKRLSIVSV